MDGTAMTVTIVAGTGLAAALFLMFYVGWLWCCDEVERYERWLATAAPDLREETTGDGRLRW